MDPQTHSLSPPPAPTIPPLQLPTPVELSHFLLVPTIEIPPYSSTLEILQPPFQTLTSHPMPSTQMSPRAQLQKSLEPPFFLQLVHPPKFSKPPPPSLVVMHSQPTFMKIDVVHQT